MGIVGDTQAAVAGSHATRTDGTYTAGDGRYTAATVSPTSHYAVQHDNSEDKVRCHILAHGLDLG